ncbi:MAG TPA: TolC family protein [Bacteroidales bacterium]|nr:TolC family protein [Bacteroidales bacterium]
MKSRIIISIIFVILNITFVSSQQVYDLERCILTGLENNYSIIVAGNREAISDNNYSKGNAGFLPSLDLSGRYSGTVNTTGQRLADGGENISSGIHNTTTTTGISLAWTIFQGFNVQTTYKKLNELKQIGELNTQVAVENLIADIVSEYYYFIQQKRLYSNLEFAVSLSKERVRIDEERYLLGASSKLQLLQSRVYFNSDSSRLARQNEVLRASEISLNELMAVEDLGQIIIVKDSVLVINPELDYENLLTETLSNNTILTIARKNQVVSEYDYKIIASRSYPYLNLSSGYNYTLNKYESSSLLSQQTNGMNYGLTMGIGLFDGFNQQREKMNARIEIENKELQYSLIEQEIKADLLTIFSAYLNNLRLLRLEVQNIQTATENLEIAFERYKLGNLSGLDLREVQKSLLDAEERLLLVQYQTKTAEISLLQISGRIMEYL